MSNKTFTKTKGHKMPILKLLVLHNKDFSEDIIKTLIETRLKITDTISKSKNASFLPKVKITVERTDTKTFSASRSKMEKYDCIMLDKDTVPNSVGEYLRNNNIKFSWEKIEGKKPLSTVKL